MEKYISTKHTVESTRARNLRQGGVLAMVTTDKEAWSSLQLGDELSDGHSKTMPQMQMHRAVTVLVLAGSVVLGLFCVPGYAELAGNTLLRPFTKIERPTDTTGVAWSGDGSKLATYSGYGKNISVWTYDGTELAEMNRAVTAPYFGDSIAFLDNDRFLLTPPAVQQDKQAYTLTVWDVRQNMFQEILRGSDGLTNSLKAATRGRSRFPQRAAIGWLCTQLIPGESYFGYQRSLALCPSLCRLTEQCLPLAPGTAGH
jgi:WD40 repeat protein